MEDDEFEALCSYIETQLTDDTVEDRIFRISSKRRQKVIKAQNQVGVIQFANGLQIEVLPKIVVQPDQNERKVLSELLLRLLSHVKDYPYLIAGDAQLSSKKDYPILEIFISSYIKELNEICMNGLKNSYEQVCDNLNVLKGKLRVIDNIKRNRFSLNKFFCQYQRYTPNNAVNRVIKVTLEKLLNISKSFQNRDKIYRLLDVFSQVETSANLDSDLIRTQHLDRTYKEYLKVMMWSRLFLKNSSVTSTQGNVVNTSIMFPMEKVFEDYIAYLFKKYSKDYIITTQDRSIFLVTHRNRGKFRLRPDIVVANDDAPVLIIDTKWKLLDAYNNRDNYGISQSDMYQLYAYGKKYEMEHNKGRVNKVKPPHLVLLYPENENFKDKLDNFIYEGDLVLDVIPFSFEKGKEEEQIRNILDLITSEDQTQESGQEEAAIVPLIPTGDNYEITDDDYLMAAEPFECYKWKGFDQTIIDFFGDDKTILVGCSKNKRHLEWIVTHNLYNVRLGNTKGSMEKFRDLFGQTTLLVLYDYKKPDKLSAYSITDNKEMTKQELLQLGYPNPQRMRYMTFHITPIEKDLTLIKNQRLIEKLIEMNPSNDKGTPVFIGP